MEEERKIFEETSNRFMPIGVTPVTKVRPDMAGGFRVPFNKPVDDYPIDPSDANNYPMLNPLTKSQIMRNLGIGNPEDEFEVDWNRAGNEGTAKDRIELADKLLPLLQKEQEKLHHRRNKIKQQLEQAQEFHPPKIIHGEKQNTLNSHEMGVQGLTNVGFNSMAPSHLGSSIPAVNQNFRVNTTVGQKGKRNNFLNPGESGVPQKNNLGVPDHHVNFLQNSDYPNIKASMINPQTRAELATQYGFTPNVLPYTDEVDIMTEDPEKFQQVDHWYSSLQKPNERNVEVLKHLNH